MKKKKMLVLISVMCLISFIITTCISPNAVFAETSDPSSIEDITVTDVIYGNVSNRWDNANIEEISKQADLEDITVTEVVYGNSSGETAAQKPPVAGFEMFRMTGDSKITLPTAGSGKDLKYDGINDCIAIPYSTSTRLAGNIDYTISMWFLPQENKSMNLFQQNANYGQQEAFIRIVEGKINTGLSKQSVAWQRNNGEIPVQFGQWNHVAMTKQGNNLRTYVNGVKDIDVTVNAVPLSALQPTREASFGAVSTYFFNGYLDEIQFWNVALPQDLINEWMYSGVDANHPNYDNLVLYYKLNEGTGNSSVGDAKGSFNGVLTNMSETAWVDSNIKSWITIEDESVSGYLFGSHAGGTSDFTYEIVNPCTKGTAVISTGNWFTYTPNPNENGSDSFTYRVRDFEGNYSDTQGVNITINAVNDAPPTEPGAFVSPVAGQIFLAGNSVPVTWEAATDTEGDTITYTVDFYDGSIWNKCVYSGTATSFTFTAPVGIYTTLAKFRVKASDGSLSSGFRESGEFTIIPNQYTLTYTAGVNGSISGTTTQTVNHSSSGTEVTAVPNAGYHFVKWSDDKTEVSRTDSNVTKNIDVTAIFAINQYTVTFVDWDDSVLKTETVAYGSGASAPTDPSRPADAQYTYTFTGWDEYFDNITGDLTVTATYSTELNSYTVTFVNWDDSVLKTETVDYGSAATAPTSPSRSADAQYTYTFTGWDKGFDNITGNLTVKAIYSTELNSYTVTFVNWDDSVLKTETVAYGIEACAPSDPSRPANAQYTYSFNGWDKAFDNITGDLTVKATYNANLNSYTVNFVNWDNSVLKTDNVNYGSGVIAPADPSRPADAQYTYTFAGWDKEFSSITGNLTIKATYSNQLNSYTVSFVNWDDSVLKTESVNYGNAATAPEAPSREGYTFTGWNLAYDNVTFDLIITAFFEIKSFNLNYHENGATGGTIPANTSHEYKSSVTVASNTGNLTKTGYNFSGWNTKTDGSGTSYTEGMTFLMEAANVTLYAKWTAVSSDHDSSGGSNQAPPSNNVPVTVGGQTQQQAATTITQTRDGRTVTTVALDSKRMTDIVNSSQTGSRVSIPITGKPDIAAGELNGQLVKALENKQAVLEIRTNTATYTLPAQQINIDAVSSQMGQTVKLSDIKVNIEIAKSPDETVGIVENIASNGNFSIVVPPIDFTMKCTYGDQTINVSEFSSYVERTVAIPDDVDPQKITTGVVVELDGTVRHIPTKVIVFDGKYYAQINSLTNSTYSVIWNPIDFKDAATHWAKEAINDMGSRMIISGIGNDTFEPDRDITRAEFATIIVRALGLKPGTGKIPFTDVNAMDWYGSYIMTATEYKIISGYGNGKFDPNDKITREQAMVMIDRAMNITGLKPEFKTGDVDKLLAGFNDADELADYAKKSTAACVKTGIVTGKNGKMIAPKDNITRAEVAVVIQRLLQKSNLI